MNAPVYPPSWRQPNGTRKQTAWSEQRAKMFRVLLRAIDELGYITSAEARDLLGFAVGRNDSGRQRARAMLMLLEGAGVLRSEMSREASRPPRVTARAWRR